MLTAVMKAMCDVRCALYFRGWFCLLCVLIYSQLCCKSILSFRTKGNGLCLYLCTTAQNGAKKKKRPERNFNAAYSVFLHFLLSSQVENTLEREL